VSPLLAKDKRKMPRFQVSIPIQEISLNNVRINSHTFDISSDGIGVVIDKAIPLNETLDMNLRMLDTGEAIHVRGKAVWMTVAGHNTFRAGIRLEEDCLKPIPLVLRTIRLRSHYYA